MVSVKVVRVKVVRVKVVRVKVVRVKVVRVKVVRVKVISPAGGRERVSATTLSTPLMCLMSLVNSAR